MTLLRQAIAAIALVVLTQPTLAQITVLDSAQDGATQPAPAGAAAAPCGTRPLTIARMNWPSAAILAEIHSRILAVEFGCQVQVVPADMGGAVSSMGSTGQPQIAPELWVNRVADLWNGAMERQQVRSAAPTYTQSVFEGWFMPASLAAAFSATPAAADLASALPQVQGGTPLRFISCPTDWACSIINRNLVVAHGLGDIVDIVEPANRLEMDRLIAEGLNRREPFLFYYWQPNAILAQLDFVAIDMGEYDEAAAQCLAGRACADPKASAFPSDNVVIAVAERVFTETPAIAGYLQRASLPLEEMNRMLAQLNEPGATAETVADGFIAERGDLWTEWIGSQP